MDSDIFSCTLTMSPVKTQKLADFKTQIHQEAENELT